MTQETPLEPQPASSEPPTPTNAQTSIQSVGDNAPEASPTQASDLPQSTAATRRLWPAFLAASLAGGLLVGGTLVGVSTLGVLPQSTDRSAEIRGIAERLAALEAQRTRVQTMETQLGRMETRLVLSEKQVTEQKKNNEPVDALAANLATLRQDMDELTAKLRSLDQQRAQGAPTPELGAAQQELEKFRKELAALSKAGASLSKNAGLAVAGANLKSAIERGTPFALELAAVKAMGISGADVDQLAAMADKSIASPHMLMAQFQPLAAPMIAAATPLPEETVDRVILSLTRLVSIRATKERAGDDVDAVIARIEAHLSRNELAAALQTYQKLPVEAQKVSADFGAHLQARVNADALSARIAAQVTQTLAPRE